MISIILAALTISSAPTPMPVSSLNVRLRQVIQSVASAPRVDPLASLSPHVSLTEPPPHCRATHIRASRLFRFGAQLVNAFVVGNAVRHGAHGHVFGNGSPLGYAAEYAALDLLVDHLDRRASCDVQAKLNAFFGLGALYNAKQTEFPK